MKKVFSIVIVSLILISAMHVTVATHFCGGVVAASKISLSGELASCGMEGPENAYPVTGNYLSSHCCRDEVSVYAVDDNYTPSFSVSKQFSQPVLQVLFIPLRFSFYSMAALNSLPKRGSPPGKLLARTVNLADICLFRI
jgi:hypothetical protein